MKAIVNLTGTDNYKLTYDVKHLFCNHVIIDDGTKIVRLNLDDVIIVDLQQELQQAYDNLNWGFDCNTYQNLIQYCIKNKIKIPQPKYSCPA